ncbi:exo-alpha-sialidase [Mariniphaga sediminis]|uniref:Exo-alpha-sialidase n=1 Tax=Mariniphaga sediminis TaxID=1628158 RepID=A0A399D3Q4_9BACT|nr:sialidase family protein [Mariniphaga sediminis]RIH65292.1 exo-alpha-sialidase [Mariniphaga sediminis]
MLIFRGNRAQFNKRILVGNYLQRDKFVCLCKHLYVFPVSVFILLIVSCQSVPKKATTVTVKDYRIFYDGQSRGFNTIWGSFILVENELIGVFTGGTYGDMTTGKRPFLIRSKDMGKTWSEPVLFGEELLVNPDEWEKEALRLTIFGPTRKGTLISTGDQFIEGEKGSGALKDPQWRAHTLNIGRKSKESPDWNYTRYSSGTFLGEQFVTGGMQLPDGRIIFTIWGAKNKGENWRCGVLTSDDDGITWKYSDVAYEGDENIRDRNEVVAGFNEQSLFLTDEGKLVSIIRGREKLGRLAESPKDTWFFRSESNDRGETWSDYELTNIAGTGAAAVGLTLPDGSLLHACRVPYSRELYDLPNPDLYGLHFARSFDEGRTWQSEYIIQKDPEGNQFNNYYNAMNGQFLKLTDNEWLYIFGQFDKENEVYRILSCKIVVS